MQKQKESQKQKRLHRNFKLLREEVYEDLMKPYFSAG
jgi:hypothetical protein